MIHARNESILAASIFLILVSCTALAYAANKLFGEGRYSPWERLLYAPVYALARILWRVEIVWGEVGWGTSNRNPIPSRDCLLAERLQGGALLVANHRCSLDPFFVQLISGKRVHWMVAGEYFRHPLFGPVLRAYQAIPTNRGGVDTASTKSAIALARGGRFVGMFPEGRINRTDSPLLSIRPGAAIVAQRANVPLIPIWIEGAPRGWAVYSGLFMAAKVKIFVGCPRRSTISGLDLHSSQDERGSANSMADEGANAGTDLERMDSNITEQETLRVHRTKVRGEACRWISDVMQESLALGGHCDESIGIAGRKWLDN